MVIMIEVQAVCRVNQSDGEHLKYLHVYKVKHQNPMNYLNINQYLTLLFDSIYWTMQYDLKATKSIILDKFRDIFVVVFDHTQKQSIKPKNQTQPHRSFNHPSKSASQKNNESTDIKNLKEVVENKALFNKIAAIIQEILLWIYAYYLTYETMRQADTPCDMVQQMINIQAEHVQGRELENSYYMGLLKRRKVYGWSKDFCKNFFNCKKQLRKHPQIDHYIDIDQIMHEYVIRRQNILDQNQPKSNHLESIINQSFQPERELPQIQPLGKIRQITQQRTKQRTERVIQYIKHLKNHKVFQINTSHQQAIAEEVVIYLDIFMSKFIKQILQYALVCNDKLKSESAGDQIRYLSKEGFTANKFYEKKINSMAICPQSYGFKRVVYPSQLEQHNNLMVTQFQTEKEYFDLMLQKYAEKYSSINQKKLMKSYFYKWNDQVQPPQNKKEQLPLKSQNKTRIIISSKILQCVLASPKYQWCLASELSLFNCM